MFNANSFEFTSVLEAYKILNIPLCSSFDPDVKKAYKKLALEYHPDKNKAENAEEMFKLIANAYSYLENFKDRIIENSSEILKFKETDCDKSKDAPSAEAQTEMPPQPTKECAANSSEQQRTCEITQLLSVFNKNPFPTIFNQDQLYALLIQKVTSTLLSETKLLEDHIDNFIHHLYFIQRSIIDKLKTEINYVQAHVFAEDEIKSQARIQLLKNYVIAINEDIQFLKEKNQIWCHIHF